MQTTWIQIADVLDDVARILQAEWQCGFPPFDSLPSEALDVACDAWCLKLAADLTEPLSPPDIVRPWILARLVSMSSQAKQNAKLSDIPAPTLSPSIVQQFLIGEWHGALKDRWPLLMTLDDKPSA